MIIFYSGLGLNQDDIKTRILKKNISIMLTYYDSHKKEQATGKFKAYKQFRTNRQKVKK